ncbi:MAG: MATE family efflux transporter [Bacteroidaceae bacterium]|nr:MATE family efflux transporter [Bacteroidaceae bacterium]
MNLRNRQILHIALPSIVSNITVPLLGLIDVAITGHIGAAAYIGAIAVGGMLFNIIYWMFAFLRMGTSGMTAQARGRRDFNEVVKLLIRSLGIALGVAFVLLLVSPVVKMLALQIIAPGAEVGNLSGIYFDICIWGAPASLGLFALNGWFIGMQNSKTPMLIAISQNLVNIIASLCLVFGLDMKIEGIAIGTVIAQWSGFVAALWLLRKHYRRLWQGGWPQGIWNTAAILRFFNVNKDIFLRTLCLIFVHFFFIAAGAKQGDTELAVNTLLMQFFTLYSYFMDGFAFAGEALAGKAIGAKSRLIYHSVVRHLFGWGATMAVLFTLLYCVAGPWFIHLLTDEETVIQTTAEYQTWTLLIPLCGMAAFIWDGIYIGATATRYMLLSMAISMAVFFCLYGLLIPTLANHGLWISFLCYLAMRGVVLTVTRKQIERLTI